MKAAGRLTGTAWIAVLTLGAIVLHLVLRYVADAGPTAFQAPLIVALVVGGVPLVVTLLKQLFTGQFGADLLAGLAILSSVWLGEYLVAAVVVLMLSGGQALEAYATHHASSMLEALARRHPSVAHRLADDVVKDVPIDEVQVGDRLVVLPNEICPVDGVVRAGESTMDEAYLSGEPFRIRKTVGAIVMSGAVNGDGVLTIVAERRAVDSRYAQIMAIVARTEKERPPMRRLADRLGAWYTPAAVIVASASWWASGDPSRFLAVLVIATPCPLLLAIPVVIMSAISVAARRGIVIKDASVLEKLETCRTAIFDKTGTLTFGRPALTEISCAPGFTRTEILGLAGSLEQYSRHPLASAVVEAAARERAPQLVVDEISEPPGRGLTGRIGGRVVRLTSRRHASLTEGTGWMSEQGGLEAVLVIDDVAAAILRFRDAPRGESPSFIGHLAPRHRVDRVMLVSGDRESEVRYLAGLVGITTVFASQSPEAKVGIVRTETSRQPTLFVGDGVNDAPAMLAATVGVALGHQNEITGEAAGAVILDSALSKVDELLHIAQRTRRIALESAVGGMLLSVVGMGFAAAGVLPPLAGALAQEAIDVAAVLNALRAAWPPRALTDFDESLR